MVKLLFSILCGWLLHKSIKPRTRLMDYGWPNLTEQTLGTMLVFPFFLLWFRSLKSASTADRLTGSFFLSALGVGLGDSAGYFFENDQRE